MLTDTRIAYQQALSCDVPILAWDQGGPWRDPSYYPDRVVFAPVSSVPYWDARCGRTFAAALGFAPALDSFWAEAGAGRFHPRQFILEHLTLAKCARDYVRIAAEVRSFAITVPAHDGRQIVSVRGCPAATSGDAACCA